MNQGGDRGKQPNKFGTEPKQRSEQTFQQPLKSRGQGRAGQGSANQGLLVPGKLRRERPRNRKISEMAQEFCRLVMAAQL